MPEENGEEYNDELNEPFNEGHVQQWFDRKTEMMVAQLGAEHDVVLQTPAPYIIGGGLDLYYFPNGISGTAIATKELSEVPGVGSTNDVFDNYEFVMFTKHAISPERNSDGEFDEKTPFGSVHHTIRTILNCMAPYGAQASLNPHETCEFPAELEVVGGRCLIFDTYGTVDFDTVDFGNKFGMLAIIEIHRSEMDFARESGGQALIEKLMKAGHYPYSDMDRTAVV